MSRKVLEVFGVEYKCYSVEYQDSEGIWCPADGSWGMLQIHGAYETEAAARIAAKELNQEFEWLTRTVEITDEE